MQRHVARLIVMGTVAAVLGWWLAAEAAAENQGERTRGAGEMVSGALRAEIEGKNSAREGLLESALEQSPAHLAARWHSGYVRADKRWVKFDQVPPLVAEDERLALYRRTREKYPDTVQGQMALAEWCGKRKLYEQQRAHLAHVLQIEPEHGEARRLLGYRLVDGVWLTPQEIGQSQARAEAAVAAMRKWQPKLLEIRTAMEGRKGKQQEAAAARLEAIQDPAAVTAIELIFCCRDEAMAQEGLRKLAGMTANEASVALARQAVFSPWPAVRRAAAGSLKSRAWESFVPVLLSAMSSPIASRVELFQEPSGRLLYRHAFYREGQDHSELVTLDSLYMQTLQNDEQVRVNAPDPTLVAPGARPIGMATRTNVDYDKRLADQAAARRIAEADAARKARFREAVVAWQNMAIEDLNGRICDVLSAATSENLPADPEDWWDWWIDYNEVYVPGYKPVKTAYQSESQTIATPSRVTYEQTPVYHSCLAPGTPVWTDSGPVPIERVEVGDRVLSQHPETGELAYKPVLAKTVREKAPIVRLELLDDTIRSSGGHPFWIAGKGWVKARDIRPGANFHGAAGTTPLRHTGSEGVERVHNLIVADFHSYFVGRAMLYSHDITARTPTNKLVPGLVDP